MKIAVAASLFLIFCITSISFAQFDDENPGRMGIRVMNFMPLGDVPSGAKSNWIGLGADWYTSQNEDGRPVSYLTIAFVGSGGDDSSRKANEICLTKTTLRRTPISDTRSHYVGYGYGIYRLRISQPGGFAQPRQSESALRPGFHVLYGQEFKSNYFAELRLDLQPNFLNSQWGGIFLHIGTRASL